MKKILFVLSLFVTCIMTSGSIEKSFTYGEIPGHIVNRISGVSHKEDAPLKISDLSYVKIKHYGFDDKIHSGEIIVNKSLASDVCEIFEQLYNMKFPIASVKLIDDYNADDILSMNDNNSSAYNVRKITGKSNKYSKHSYGIAIDINPVQNPYVKDDVVLPKVGKSYLNRCEIKKGMIRKNDKVYNLFVSRGWKWGGDWNSLKDYQHFEKDLKK